MKKNVLVFGLISGGIITLFMIFATVACYSNPNFKSNDVIGYAGMIAAFSFIFLGIKNYRDKFNNGVITFGKAFKTGLYITLVASTMYVGVWLIEYYLFIPDFMDKYILHVLNEAKANGAGAAEINKKAEEMAGFKEMYKNPLFVILISYAEVVPIGVVISVIGGLVLKRKVSMGA